ncbi:acyl carrier protein [Streptomyces sp. NPDC002181]|uniref:acyl carrier protein n=1 Tax=unclassified Streptomyces TaxID=2593676 RepID=UPI00365937B5
MSHYDVGELVRSIVIDTLDIPAALYRTDLVFSADLGLESLDLLDIFFRIECSAPVVLTVEKCGRYLQGDVPDAEFCDARGIISGRGLSRLHTVMPQLDTDRWAGSLTLDRMLSELSIANLISMVENLLAEGQAAAHA